MTPEKWIIDAGLYGIIKNSGAVKCSMRLHGAVIRKEMRKQKKRRMSLINTRIFRYNHGAMQAMQSLLTMWNIAMGGARENEILISFYQ